LDDITGRLRKGGTLAVGQEQVQQALSAVVRLYAAACEATGIDLAPLEPDVSTTDAVVMACAMLKARDLNPFDLALWFSRTRVAG
jgi:hypothetical protein